MHLEGQFGRTGRALLLLIAGLPYVHAQSETPSQAPPAAHLPGDAEQNIAAGCFEPPPLLRWQDYDGPFARIVAGLGRKVERTSVHAPRYKPGVVLCSLEPGRKFILFVRSSVDPLSFVTAAFNAGISPTSDPSFGQGAQGYAKRFGAAYADETTARFFGGFVFPTLLHEDPRYYRLAQGRAGTRLAHALTHVVVGHKDDGHAVFNFSEWLGTGSAVALGYAWHPDNAPGFGAGARTVGFAIAGDAGFDVLREFWPEVARAFHLPFRGSSDPAPQPGLKPGP